MAGYLIAEEGPLAGLVITFEEGNQWILGRDPDEATIVLEDPMVSRKHVICRQTSEGFVLENLSSVNPATQNGKIITEEVLLKEGDILEIGTTFFRFSEKNPNLPKEEPEDTYPFYEEETPLTSIDLEAGPLHRWLLKVISGPNTGAEFHLAPKHTYLLGKDSQTCDVVFYDLSVSKEHARIEVAENDQLFIEDLGSLNGVLLNGEKIEQRAEISSQDIVSLGTTSFLLIDCHKIHETIVSAAPIPAVKKEEELAVAPSILQEEVPKQETSWKNLVISKKHLMFGMFFALFILGLIASSFSLFQSKEVVISTKHESKQVAEALEKFPSVQYSFNLSTGKLFLVGHVLTSIEKQELSYTLSNLPFIQSIEDTVVIDELVWQNMNEILQLNSDWQAVSIHAPLPGKFVMKGYVKTTSQAEALTDYMNSHFPYLDLLENAVNITNNMTIQVENLLMSQGFSSLAFSLTGGDLIITGSLNKKNSSDLENLIEALAKIPGIISVQNYVLYSQGPNGSQVAGGNLTNQGEPNLDLSQNYIVSGFSHGDNNEEFAIINTKIFTTGDFLDGMQITAIEPTQILLEKDGIKFRINYNLQ